MLFRIGGTEAMRIDPNGNVAIGTATANNYTNFTTLTLNGTTGGIVDFENNGTLVGEIYNDASALHLVATSSKDLRFSTNGTNERMRIDTSGNVGIGTSSPSQKLHVSGQALFNNGSDFYVNSASAATVLDAKSGVLRFDMNGTERMRINSEGYITLSGATNYSNIQFKANGTVRGYVGPAGFLGGSDNDFGLRAEGGNTVFYSSSAEKVRIDSSGKVGINKTSPATKLHVDGGSTGSAFTIDNGGYGTMRMGAASNGGNLISVGTGEKLIFGHQSAPGTSYTERMRIDSSGKVGIGQTSPAAKLDVNGNYTSNVTAVAALAIDCSAGNYFTKTINANSTFTFSNVPSSRSYSFTLELTHTSGTVTWPSSVKFPADTAPTLTTGKTHLFVFVTDDGGTRFRGAALADYVN